MHPRYLFAVTTFLAACAPESNGEAQIDASAREAITWADGESSARSVSRDPAELTDERILEETRAVADFAVEHGCDVDGALGGVWTRSDAAEGSDAPGGELVGRWFRLDLSIGGDLAGAWTPDASGDGAGTDGAGTIDADWEGSDGLTGTLGGTYYGSGDGDGTYLARYTTEDGASQGLLGGIWYETTESGGTFFGVWGHCSEGTDGIEEGSY